MESRVLSRRYIYLVLLAILALTWTLVCLKYFSNPYLWIFPSWILAGLIAVVAITRPAARAIFVNFAVVFALLWIFEWYAYSKVRQSEPAFYIFSEPYFSKDHPLGYAPVKGIIARSKRVLRNTVLYDVSYTIGSNGLRISPPDNGPHLKGSVLFFGGSFTYGEGLSDNQTMPYRVGVHTQGEYRTYNFGFHAYGPNQMLAALEQGIVEQAVKSRPTHAFYQCIPDHVHRVAGLHVIRHVPRYRLMTDGSVKREGFFDDEDFRPGLILAKLQLELSKSNVSKLIRKRVRSVKNSDIDLFLAIVKGSEQVISKKFPGCQFHVILWSSQSGLGTYRKILEGLRVAGLQVHLVDDILPDYTTNPHQYEISKYDRHPNALANDMIAEYIAKRIIEHK
jgi:hypothetical protein